MKPIEVDEMKVPRGLRLSDGQWYQGRNRREHLIHLPAYGWWQPVRDKQIKRGESDRQARLSLNAKDLPYNRKGNREEFIREADEVVRARMRGDSITSLYAKGLWVWMV